MPPRSNADRSRSQSREPEEGSNGAAGGASAANGSEDGPRVVAPIAENEQVTATMMYTLIDQMRQDRVNQDRRLQIMEDTLRHAQQPRVQQVQARPHLEKLNSTSYTRDWSRQSLRTICMFVEDAQAMLEDGDRTFRMRHDGSREVRYRNNDLQKNGDIFNILMESLGDKAADHVDKALEKAAKEDPQFAESAYIVWQALHEVHVDKVTKHLADLDRLTCAGNKPSDIHKYLRDFKDTRKKIHKAMERGPLLAAHEVTMAKALMKHLPKWIHIQTSTILLGRGSRVRDRTAAEVIDLAEEILEDSEIIDTRGDEHANSAEYGLLGAGYESRKPPPSRSASNSPRGRTSNRFVRNQRDQGSARRSNSPTRGRTAPRQPTPRRQNTRSPTPARGCVICGEPDHKTHECRANCWIPPCYGKFEFPNHHPKCKRAWVDEKQANSATESPRYETPHERYDANLAREDTVEQPEDYSRLAHAYGAQSTVSPPGLDMHSTPARRVTFADTHTNIRPDLLPCEVPPATSTMTPPRTAFKCNHDNGENCEFCVVHSVVPSVSECASTACEQHNDDLARANALLDAHLNEDTPRDNTHADKTISMIDQVMDAVGGPDVFYDAQSHGRTYYDALDTPPVSAKHLRKLQRIAMAMSAEPTPTEQPRPVKRVAPVHKSNIPAVLNMLCLLTTLVSRSQALLPVTGDQIAPPFGAMQPEHAYTARSNADLQGLQIHQPYIGARSANKPMAPGK